MVICCGACAASASGPLADTTADPPSPPAAVAAEAAGADADEAAPPAAAPSASRRGAGLSDSFSSSDRHRPSKSHKESKRTTSASGCEVSSCLSFTFAFSSCTGQRARRVLTIRSKRASCFLCIETDATLDKSLPSAATSSATSSSKPWRASSASILTSATKWVVHVTRFTGSLDKVLSRLVERSMILGELPDAASVDVRQVRSWMATRG
mmetsp:Transcript_101160/g.163163  ORF Transcript_101160/g.163163 Transcript_101160/m.163163 type:complete len:210 (+) Transcript_101160:1678-2307(+)